MTFEEIIANINGGYITALGTISSIVGLFLSVLVLLGVKKIKKFYNFTARVPSDKEKLVEIASSMSNHLNGFDGYSTATHEILANAEVTLNSLGRKVDGPLKKQVNRLVKDIKSINKERPPVIESLCKLVGLGGYEPGLSDKDFLEKIYLSLYKIIQECSARYEDARWER